MKFPYFTTIGTTIGFYNYVVISEEIEGTLGQVIGISLGISMGATGSIIDILLFFMD